MKIDRSTALGYVVVFFIGWYFASSSRPAPTPDPLHERPALRWVIRTAKVLLWGLAFAEPQPAPHAERLDGEARLARSPDQKGRIDWSEGW
jgi:hypothetical protein